MKEKRPASLVVVSTRRCHSVFSPTTSAPTSGSPSTSRTAPVMTPVWAAATAANDGRRSDRTTSTGTVTA